MKEYVINKMSFISRMVDSISVAEIKNKNIESFETRDRLWLVRNLQNGNNFFKVTKKQDGRFYTIEEITYNYFNQTINCGLTTIPENISNRKIFLSYYHHDDQKYKRYFENLFGDLIINKSVENGDIAPDNSAEYTRHLIQQGYLSDSTVIVLLIGPHTKNRKHIDWELYGALDYKVGDRYAGLLGIVLPEHPDFRKDTFYSDYYPPRYIENVKSKYALIMDWTENRCLMQKKIEKAFAKRMNTDLIINHSIPQMKRNLSDEGL